MPLFEAINRAQTITLNLLNEQPDSIELKALLSELSQIEMESKHIWLKATKNNTNPEINMDEKSGCYHIEGDANLYCPRCYEKDKNLSATQRINSRLRVCSSCRQTIKLR